MRPRLFWEQKTWKQSEFTSHCLRKVIMYRYGCSSCTWAVKFHTDHQRNQSKHKANSCSRRQAREIACGDVAKGSSLFLIGRKCGATIFQPTIKRIRTKFTLDWISSWQTCSEITCLFFLGKRVFFHEKNCFPWSYAAFLALKSHLSVVRLLQTGTNEWKVSFERNCGTPLRWGSEMGTRDLFSAINIASLSSK